MKAILIGLAVFLLHFEALGSEAPRVEKKINFSLELLYRNAQREFLGKNYSAALLLFNKYLVEGKAGLNKEERLFWVIDQIAYIFLKVNMDPDGAIKFFKKYETDRRFNEAEQSSIAEWISAARDWKKIKTMPHKTKDADVLFIIGSQYFKKGMAKQKGDNGTKGNADLAISESYLLPFVFQHDKDKRIPEALLMVGSIRYFLRTDSEYWSENHYLKEVIRRFPKTEHA